MISMKLVVLLSLFLCYTLAGKFYIGPNGVDVLPCNTTNPCLTLEFVLSIAPPDSIISFSAGNYSVNSPSVSLSLDSMTIQGESYFINCNSSYNSSSTSVFSASYDMTSITGMTISGCPCTVFSVTNESHLILQDVTVSNSVNSISAESASVSISNCSFCTSMGSSRSAVEIIYSTFTISNTNFSGSTTLSPAYPASALAISASIGTITNAQFCDCQTSTGSVIYIADNSPVTIDNITVTGNKGTGIFIQESQVVISNSVIANNNVIDLSGGGINAVLSSLNISASNITGNTGTQGGGLYLFNSSGIIENTNVTQNSAPVGSGIYLAGDYFINFGAVDGIFFATESSAQSLRVMQTYVTNNSTQVFCCAGSSSFDHATGNMSDTLCYYPACNPDQCQGADACVCPGSIYANQSVALAQEVCTCSDFDGLFCTEFNCTAGNATCSGVGICDSIQGCQCDDFHYGTFCENFCDSVRTCSGNGACNATGYCDCNAGFNGTYCNETNVATTSGRPTTGTTGFFHSTTGYVPPPHHVLPGNCKVYAEIYERKFASWQVNGTIYEIYDIQLVNNGLYTATDVQITLDNAVMGNMWGFELISSTGARSEFTLDVEYFYPGQYQTFVGFVNEGLTFPSIESLSCNTTDQQMQVECNGVQVQSFIITANYVNNMVVTEYGIAVTNRGNAPITQLHVQITNTDGTTIKALQDLTQVNGQNNVYLLDIGKVLDVGQSLYHYKFTLLGSGAASASCADSQLYSPSQIVASSGLSKRQKDGAIIGAVIGGALLIAIIIALVLFAKRKRRTLVNVPSFERTSVYVKPRFGIAHMGDGYDKSNPSAADSNL